jgi:hypothetical protein
VVRQCAHATLIRPWESMDGIWRRIAVSQDLGRTQCSSAHPRVRATSTGPPLPGSAPRHRTRAAPMSAGPGRSGSAARERPRRRACPVPREPFDATRGAVRARCEPGAVETPSVVQAASALPSRIHARIDRPRAGVRALRSRPPMNRPTCPAHPDPAPLIRSACPGVRP